MEEKPSVEREQPIEETPTMHVKPSPVVLNRQLWIASLTLLGCVLTIATQVLDLVRVPLVSDRVDQWMGRDVEPPRAVVADVGVSVDRDDRTYLDGDDVHVTVSSDQAGYVYLLSKRQDQVILLYPRQSEVSNSIAENKKFPWTTRAGPPFGKRTLQAIVTFEPLRLSDLRGDAGSDDGGFSADQLNALRDRLEARDASDGWQWAEAQVEFEIINPDP